MKPITETIETTLNRIRETMALSSAQQITVPPPDEKRRVEIKRQWLDKWVRIRAHHPQLQNLEDEIYSFCREYSRTPGRGHRLILYGENGSGKSHVAKAISRWAKCVANELPRVLVPGGLPENPYAERAAKCEFWNWPRFLKTLKGQWEMVEELAETDLLILDDLGAEHDPSKFGMSELYLLLERREHKWTVVTTNVGPDDWESRFERRIASRFLRNSTHVALDKVPDYNSI